MAELINDARARWADNAIRAFKQATGAEDDTALGDLLCDLAHHARRQGLEPREVFERALTLFETEEQEDAEKPFL